MDDLFSAFGDPIRKCGALQKTATVKTYPAKTMILSEKDSGNSVYFILDGSVDITRYSSQGREVWHSRLETGQQFGEMSAITGEPRSANVVTVTETRTAVVSQAEFLKIVRDDPDFALWFLRDLALRLENSTRQTYEVVTMNVQKRICAELVRRTEDEPNSNGEYPITPNPVLAQLARQLNTDRETISRSISAMVKNGVLRREDRQLIIVDRDALINRAGE